MSVVTLYELSPIIKQNISQLKSVTDDKDSSPNTGFLKNLSQLFRMLSPSDLVSVAKVYGYDTPPAGD